MTSLSNLRAKVEAATEGSRELDWEIVQATDPGMAQHVRAVYESNKAACVERGLWPARKDACWRDAMGGIKLYTASLDAAVALTERLLPDSDIDLQIRPGMTGGRVHTATDASIYGHIHGPHESVEWKGFGWTPALALIAATLRAMEEGAGNG